MIPKCALVFFAFLALASATNVKQCKGQSIPGLKDLVQLTPCVKPPCELKKGKDQAISIIFTPEADIEELKNSVSAEVFGTSLPFVGVDGLSVCDKLYDEAGEKVSCPLTAGKKYEYKDSFPILPFYPSISVRVHWALQSSQDIICFEVPAKIV